MCDSKDSITVDYQLDFDLGADTTLCTGQTVTLTTPSLPSATYQWQDGTSSSNQYVVDKAGEYSIRIKQATCLVADTIRVRYVRPPMLELGPDQMLCGAQTFMIRPTVAEGEFSGRISLQIKSV